MKKLFYIITFLLCFSLCSCGSTDTPKSAELSEKYNFYEKSVDTIRKGCNVTAEEADEIFLILVNNCDISDLINYVFVNYDGTFSVWSSGIKYTMTLENGIVSTVFTTRWFTDVQLYPESEDNAEFAKENITSDEVEDIESEKYNSLSQLKLDELQQLYLDFDTSMSYSDALEYIQNTGLPYSEEKYNGSRRFQVALKEGCTAQKYMKESGPYIIIDYVYAKGENSINDDKTKYSFGTCVYNPIVGPSLIIHNTGYYFDISESGTYIKQGGDTLDELTNLSKEEQLLYYFNNQ